MLSGVSSGKGLAITRGRLESLYGRDQSLVLRDLPTGGAEARITMPFRSQEEASPFETDILEKRKEVGNAEFQSINR